MPSYFAGVYFYTNMLQNMVRLNTEKNLTVRFSGHRLASLSTICWSMTKLSRLSMCSPRSVWTNISVTYNLLWCCSDTCGKSWHNSVAWNERTVHEWNVNIIIHAKSIDSQRVRLDKDWIVPIRWSWITEPPLVGQAPSWVYMMKILEPCHLKLNLQMK